MATYTNYGNQYIPEATAGTLPVDDDYTNWITEGLQHIINAIPTDMLWMFETSESDVPNDGVFVGTNKIMYVQRESDSNLVDSNSDGTNDAKMLVECREVPASLRGRITPGSGWQEEASETDPVWFKLGGKVYMFPSSTSINSKAYWIKNPPEGWTGGSEYLDGTVPTEVDPLIMSHAIYKGLCKVHADILVEQRDSVKDLHTIMTEIDAAFTLGKNALAKVDSEIWSDDNVYYNGEFVKIAASIKRAELLIADYSGYDDLAEVKDASGSEIFSAIKLLEEEETDLVQVAIGVVQAELARAQTESAQIDQILKTAMAEAQGHFGEVSSRIAILSSEMQEYQLNTAQRVSVSQSIMTDSQKFEKEFKEGLMMLMKGSYEAKTIGDTKNVPTYSGMKD